LCVSINLHDLGDPHVLLYTGGEPAKIGLSIKKSEQARLIAADPFAAAEWFDTYCKSIIKFLFGGLLAKYAPEGHEGEPRSKTLMGPGKFGYMFETKLGVLHEDSPTTQMFITNNALADSGLLFHHTGPNTGKRIVPSAELAKSDMNLFDRLLDIPLAITIRIKKVSCEGVKKEGRGGRGGDCSGEDSEGARCEGRASQTRAT